MTLVEVVSGQHRRMHAAQRLGELRLALQADPKRVGAELGEGKHLSGDLEHRGLGTERKSLLGSGKREAIAAKLGGLHPSNVAWSNIKSASPSAQMATDEDCPAPRAACSASPSVRGTRP